MQKDNRSMYKTARESAGLTQETAAERLDVSVETVRAYETGQRLPPDQAVAAMARVYATPWLVLEHASATDELGIVPPGARRRTLAQAVLHLIRTWRETPRHEQRLLEIAEDGSVTDDEREDLARISDFVGSVVAACLEFQCCDAKKERPEGGASKRSRSQGKPENHCRPIITGFPAERKPFFREELTSL